MTVDKCVAEVQTVAWKTSPSDPAYWDEFRRRGLEIVTEDKRLFHTLQRSMRSGVIAGIKMGFQERSPYWFEEELDRVIGPENIPEAMRVAQVIPGSCVAEQAEEYA